MLIKRWHLYINRKYSENNNLPISLTDLVVTVRSLKKSGKFSDGVKWSRNSFISTLKEHSLEKIVEETDTVEKIQIEVNRGETFI